LPRVDVAAAARACSALGEQVPIAGTPRAMAATSMTFCQLGLMVTFFAGV
jgi:hypothetical protein